jgi:tetratricopeptide (TPR) repeat protein
MALTGARFLRQHGARVGHASLHAGGRVTRTGVIFGVVMVAWLAFLAQAGALKAMAFTGGMRVRAATAGGAARDPAALADGIQLLQASVRFAPVAMPRWDGQLAEALALADRHEDAERHYRSAVQHAPQYVAAWHELAQYAIARGDHAAASEALGRIVEIPPADGNADLWLELATQHVAAANDTAALEAATRAVELEPDVLAAHVIGAETALRLERADAATRFVAQARRLAPEDSKVIEIWVRHLKNSGELEAAIANAERTASTSRQARVELAFLYQAAGRYDDARRVATQLGAETQQR